MKELIEKLMSFGLNESQAMGVIAMMAREGHVNSGRLFQTDIVQHYHDSLALHRSCNFKDAKMQALFDTAMHFKISPRYVNRIRKNMEQSSSNE